MIYFLGFARGETHLNADSIEVSILLLLLVHALNLDEARMYCVCV
jgi:hypothetical protein